MSKTTNPEATLSTIQLRVALPSAHPGLLGLRESRLVTFTEDGDGYYRGDVTVTGPGGSHAICAQRVEMSPMDAIATGRRPASVFNTPAGTLVVMAYSVIRWAS